MPHIDGISLSMGSDTRDSVQPESDVNEDETLLEYRLDGPLDALTYPPEVDTM